jgi:membrane protease YdiL (CAAX protease family)
MHYVKPLFRLLIDIVVALSAIGACVAIYRLGIMVLLENVFSLNALPVTILRRIGVTAALLVAYWAVARYYERRIITEFAFKPVAISISAFLGMALIGITILSLYAMDNYQLLSFRGYTAALPIITVIVFAVVFEEVIFRGVVFRLLERHAGTAKALVTQALVFGGLHIFNDGASVMTVISVTLLGAFWASIYVYSRNLWVVIANHAAWNVSIFISGVPLSGQQEWSLSAPLESRYGGPVWLTGGDFGPEDSIINILVMACALAGLAYRAWRQGFFVKGSWAESEA